MYTTKQQKPQQSRVFSNVSQRKIKGWNDEKLNKGTKLYHATKTIDNAKSIIEDGIKLISRTSQLGRGFYLSSDANAIDDYGQFLLEFELQKEAHGQTVPQNLSDEDVWNYFEHASQTEIEENNDYIHRNDRLKQYKFHVDSFKILKCNTTIDQLPIPQFSLMTFLDSIRNFKK
mgnify:CR=1 FL=1